MGVSIKMTPGPVGRNFGEQVSITPGWRSQAASILRSHFGEAPFTLVADQDIGVIQLMYEGASVYAADKENMWSKIAEALREHGSVTITMDY